VADGFGLQSATAVIIKHANPCGAATAESIFTAYCKALETDPVSAFGGIVALNRMVDGKTAAEIGKLFLEILIAPAYDSEARAILSEKKNLRVLEIPSAGAGKAAVMTSVASPADSWSRTGTGRSLRSSGRRSSLKDRPRKRNTRPLILPGGW